MRDLLLPGIEDWMGALLGVADATEEAMRREGEDRDFPIVGPLVGRFLEVLTRIAGARRVFEMGSGFGYSTFHFARAVGEDGLVVHTDTDADNAEAARGWLGQAGLLDRVRFETGDALASLAAEPDPFDVVFIDIDKPAYPAAWKLATQKVPVGGMVIADNTLWSGRVADPAQQDASTQGIRSYVEAAFDDASFRSTIVPLRDGVCVSLRIS